MQLRAALSHLFAVLALGFIAGCGDDQIRSYKISRDQEAKEDGRTAKQLPPDHPPLNKKQELPPDHPPIGQPALPPDHPPIGGMALPKAQAPAEAPALAWDAPPDWVQKPAGGMRAASFEVPAANGAKGDLSVIILGGAAGGVLANVNRWRGQIQAEPWSQEALDREMQKIQAPAGTVLFFDLRKDPPGKRILGGILEREGQSWFFKLTGDDAALEGSKAAFVAFLKTVRGASQ